jgi:hypothetical protein
MVFWTIAFNATRGITNKFMGPLIIYSDFDALLLDADRRVRTVHLLLICGAVAALFAAIGVYAVLRRGRGTCEAGITNGSASAPAERVTTFPRARRKPQAETSADCDTLAADIRCNPVRLD